LVLAYNKPDTKSLFIGEINLVVFDGAFLTTTAVFGRGRRWKMPFDKTGARDQRDIVQVDDAKSKFKARLSSGLLLWYTWYST